MIIKNVISSFKNVPVGEQFKLAKSGQAFTKIEPVEGKLYDDAVHREVKVFFNAVAVDDEYDLKVFSADEPIIYNQEVEA